MKILISTKQLAQDLSKIDFETEIVRQVIGEKDKLILCTDEQNVEIDCHVVEIESIIIQENRRWDWVKQIVEQVNEQPVVLAISEHNINVIFSY